MVNGDIEGLVVSSDSVLLCGLLFEMNDDGR